MRTRKRDVVIVLRLEPKAAERERRKCKGCKCNDLKFRKGRFRRIRSLDFGRVRVYVEVEVRRIRCRKCGKMFREKIPFLTSPKARVTRAFEWEMFELRSQMSITAVAEWLDVDPDTVKDAEKRILEAKYRRVDRKGVRMIGIDELYVFGNERSNRKYITVVRDMETGAVLNVSRGGGVFPTSLRQPYPTMQILIIPGLYVLFLRIGLRRLQIKLILPRIASMNPRT